MFYGDFDVGITHVSLNSLVIHFFWVTNWSFVLLIYPILSCNLSNINSKNLHECFYVYAGAKVIITRIGQFEMFVDKYNSVSSH